jgi:hypothetical protein
VCGDGRRGKVRGRSFRREKKKMEKERKWLMVVAAVFVKSLLLTSR